MTLAQQCEAIWPCGWYQDGDHARATIAGHKASVCEQRTGLEYTAVAYPWIHRGCTGVGHALRVLREYLVTLTAMPAIKEPTLMDVLGQLLEAQGWKRGHDACAWARGVWRIRLLNNSVVTLAVAGIAVECQAGHVQLGPATEESVHQALIDLFAELPRYPNG